MISDTGEGARRRNRRGHGDLLRAELLEAATQLVAELGDADRLSMRAVAARAGVSPPSVYLHFPDKQALLEAVVEARFREFDDVLAAAADGSADVVEEISRKAHAYLQFAADHPGHYRALFGTSGLGPEAMGLGDRPFPGTSSLVDLIDVVQRCLDELGSEDDPVRLSFQLFAVLHGLADLHITCPGIPGFPPIADLIDDSLARLGLTKLATRKQ